MQNATAHSFQVIPAGTIQEILREDLRRVVDIVRSAYLAHDSGQTVNPSSVFLRMPDHPDARIIGLPAHFCAPNTISGIKWIASYPDNTRRGFARASAVLLLNDGQDGYPFACLEGSLISAARTAASAVAALGGIRTKERAIDALGLIGTGVIARTFCEFLFGTGWNVHSVHLFDVNPTAADAFTRWLRTVAPEVVVETRDDALSVVSNVEVSFLATVAAQPYLRQLSCIAHAPTILNISLRDLAPEVILEAQNVVDDVTHVMTANTSIHLAAQRCGNSDFITCTIADLLAGRRQTDPRRATIVSPFGLGILDLALGKWVYDCAAHRNATIPVPEFFPAFPERART